MLSEINVPRPRFELGTRGFSVHCSTPELPRPSQFYLATFAYVKRYSLCYTTGVVLLCTIMALISLRSPG